MRNESSHELSEEDKIRTWAYSEEGILVRKTVNAIYLHQHYDISELEELYGNDGKLELPIYPIDEVIKFSNAASNGYIKTDFIQAEKLQTLKERMPIEEIRNAMYITDYDKFILGEPDTFLMHRTQTEQLHEFAKQNGEIPDMYLPHVFGLSYKVKSTGWNVLDVWPLLDSASQMQATANKLAVRKYNFVVGTSTESYYIPPGKDNSFYKKLYRDHFE